MTDKSLRYRSLVADNLAVVVILLFVVGVVGGWLTATAYLAPGTTTAAESVTEWQSTGEFTHRATVTQPNPLYETGTTLVNRTVYFTRLTPTLDGTYTFGYAARESGTLSGQITVEAVLRGVSGDDRDAADLWQTRHVLNETTVSELSPGETVRVPFSVDLATLRNRSSAIQESLDTTQSRPYVDIVATVTYDGTINGRSVSDRARHTLSTELQGNLYRMDDARPQVDEHTTTRRVRVPASSGPLHRVGGPSLLGLSVLGLGLVGYAFRRNALDVTPRERAVLTYRDDRTDYDEWITSMSLPDDVFDRPQATTDSLARLVDFAMDTDNAVVEDPSRNAFVVVDDGCCYVYTPPVDVAGAETASPAVTTLSVPGSADNAVDASASDRPAGDTD